MPPVILAYHLVDSRFDFGATWVTPRQFERQMQWLAESGYRSRSLSECLDPQSRATVREVAITFDDGYRALMKHVLPVLQRWRFTATVFPVVDYVGKKNRWDYNLFWRRQEHLHWHELRELLVAGWEIGSHSMRHAYLPGLSAQALREDLRDSKSILEDQLQIPIAHLSLPFGRGNAQVLDCARHLGYRSVSALGQEQRAAQAHGPTGAANGICVFPRRGIYLHDTLRSFRRRVEAPAGCKREQRRQRAISFFSQGTIMVKRLGETRR